MDIDPSEQYPLNVTLPPYDAILQNVNAALALHNKTMITAPNVCALGVNFSLSPCCNNATQCVCGQKPIIFGSVSIDWSLAPSPYLHD